MKGPAVHVAELSISGSYLITPRIYADNRGGFAEWYRHDALGDAVGHPLELAQANWSSSRRGVIRGIHFADVPSGQAKYVTCVRGAVLDLVVDLRVGSPTFGRYDAVELDGDVRRAVYVSEGLGHAFCALTDDAAVIYLCSTTYDPAAEHGVNPLDPALGLPWPSGATPLLSAKDADAPSLAQALAGGILPRLDDCRARALDLRDRATSGVTQ
jgi:dTDP-4-dehydrorhamnose 3,5-epimerase